MQEDKKTKLINFFKICIRIILFCLIGIIITLAITPIFIPKWMGEYGGVTQRIQGMYNEPKNTIDYVVLGNSDAERGIVPLKIWDEFGITGYNLGSSMQTSWISYYLLKEFTKYQNPKVVLLETDCLFEVKDRKKSYVSQVYDNLRLSENKVQAILDPVFKHSPSSMVGHFFPLLKYHSRWNELTNEDFEKYTLNRDVLKGYKMVRSAKPFKGKKSLKQKHFDEIPSNSQKYADKIIDFCTQNNIKVVLVEFPTMTSWSKEKSELVSKYAQDKKIEFIDMNNMIKELGIDWKKDTPDKGNHLNVYGAEKISSYMGKKFVDEYNLISHKDDETYNSWNEDFKHYEKIKE